MPQVFDPQKLKFRFKESPLAEFSWHTSPELSKIVRSRFFKFDIRSLDPGKYSYPYHFHRNAEELFVILSGKAILRTPEGFAELTKDNVVFLEAGPSGAHQLYNHTDEPCVYLDLGSQNEVDVCEYPDSGKINITPYQEIYMADCKVNYLKGEESVAEKWPADVIKGFRNKA